MSISYQFMRFDILAALSLSNTLFCDFTFIRFVLQCVQFFFYLEQLNYYLINFVLPNI